MFHFNLPDADKRLFNGAADQLRDKLARALQLAVGELMFTLKTKGNEKILGAGNFSARWTKAFQVQSDPAISTPSDKYTISLFFDSSIPYAHIHEFGGTITAKGNLFGPPMLWIPIPGQVPKSGGGLDGSGLMTAQEFGHTVSKLFQVKRPGKKPLLFDVKQKQPRYFGMKSVTLKPRFGLRDMAKQEVADFAETYSAAVAAMNKSTG